MKRTFMVMLALGLALFLVACERPLREEAEVQVEPTAPLVVTPLGGGPGPIATPAPASPGDDGNLPATGEGTDGADAGTGETTPPGETASPDAGEPAPEESAPTEPTTPEGNVIHTVVAGDTLYNLSRFYDVDVNAIVQANQLANPNVLDVGQQLVIPVAGLPEAETTTGERTHVVGAGDTLFRIGLTYGFTVQELATYNGLVDPNRLEIGQVIKIPPAP